MKVEDKYETVGRLQLDFLKSQGLEPHHTLLDVGCGSLRGGMWIMAYLNPGCYVGIDKDADMLEQL